MQSTPQYKTDTKGMFVTSDELMFIALAAMGGEIAGRHIDNGRVYYHFDEKCPIKLADGKIVSLKDVVELIANGKTENLIFSIKAYWNCKNVWLINLRMIDR